MVKGFGEASIDHQKSSKSSSTIPAVDCEQIQKGLFEHFEELTDPRGKQGVLHPFMSIVMIALKRDNWRSQWMGGYRNLWREP